MRVFVGRKRGLIYLAVGWGSLREDEDLSEIDTTQEEFEAMWARATPVDTTTPGSQTFGCPAVITKLRFG